MMDGGQSRPSAQADFVEGARSSSCRRELPKGEWLVTAAPKLGGGRDSPACTP